MFKLNKNEVVFRKGCKPHSIRSSQHEVRDTYLALCSLNAPRSIALARAVFETQVLGALTEKIYSSTPTYHSAVTSALRAFVSMGNTLEKRTMYSMDLRVSVGDLSKFQDLSPELLAAAQAAGFAELVFLARES